MGCRFTPLVIPDEELTELKNVESINDIIDHLDRSLEGRPPEWIHGNKVGELDFFVNCSNLQVWVEHDFDTRLLDYKLSFPLLHRLSKKDRRARIRYREELVDRLNTTRNKDLCGYLSYDIDIEFTFEEKMDLFLIEGEREILYLLIEEYGLRKNQVEFDYKQKWISKLSLYHNSKIVEHGIPSFLKDLKGIESLELVKNNLSILPEWLKELSTLRELLIGANPLKNIPDWLTEMTFLESLNLIETSIEALPETFGNLTNLKELTLNYNDIKRIPDSFRNLQNLRILDLDGCNLKKIPWQFLCLQSLEELNLSFNELSHLPELAKYHPRLKSISLNNNKFSEFPLCLLRHPKLEKLFMSRNLLSSLPDSFDVNIPLEKISLSENKFTLFPITLLCIPSLKEIYIEENQIVDLDDIIAASRKASNFKILRLGGNPLSEKAKENLRCYKDSLRKLYDQESKQSNSNGTG